mgnify:FL=1
MKIRLLALLLCSFWLPGTPAVDNNDGDAGSNAVVEADSTNARSPGDLSGEERASMMRSTGDYNTCVYNHAMETIDSDPDIRRIADSAMGHCQSDLDSLKSNINEWGFPPYFADRFTRNVRDRAARKLLPELAIRKR